MRGPNVCSPHKITRFSSTCCSCADRTRCVIGRLRGGRPAAAEDDFKLGECSASRAEDSAACDSGRGSRRGSAPCHEKDRINDDLHTLNLQNPTQSTENRAPVSMFQLCMSTTSITAACIKKEGISRGRVHGYRGKIAHVVCHLELADLCHPESPTKDNA